MAGLHNMFENMLFSEEARKDAKNANMGENLRDKKTPGPRSWRYGGNQRFEPALLYDACTTCRVPTNPKKSGFTALRFASTVLKSEVGITTPAPAC